MATRIRLRRIGRKKVPLYRIVVADREASRDGRFIAVLGTYDPRAKDDRQVVLDAEQAKAWGGTKMAIAGGVYQAVPKALPCRHRLGAFPGPGYRGGRHVREGAKPCQLTPCA